MPLSRGGGKEKREKSAFSLKKTCINIRKKTGKKRCKKGKKRNRGKH